MMAKAADSVAPPQGKITVQANVTISFAFE